MAGFHHRSRKHSVRRRPLRLEQLEDRRLLAVCGLTHPPTPNGLWLPSSTGTAVTVDMTSADNTMYAGVYFSPAGIMYLGIWDGGLGGLTPPRRLCWNSLDDAIPPFTAAALSSLTVNGFEGDDTIDLSALVAPPFIALTTTVHGGDGIDVISGSGFNDQLYGDGGDDTIDGQSGDDEIFGGIGRDILYGDSKSANVGFATDGDDTIKGGPDFDLIYGGFGSDSLYGDGGMDTIHGDPSGWVAGASANDSIYGGSDYDELAIWTFGR